MIRGPYGSGMMIAWTPGDGSFEAAKQMVDMMFEDGLMGFLCGDNPSRVRFLPPPGITEIEHLDAAIAIIRRTLKRVKLMQEQV
jgi:acetylornithine aminotransferase